MDFILFGALLSQIKSLMTENLAADCMGELLNGAVPFQWESGCEITTNHQPNAGKCWLWLGSWLILQSTVAGSQSQLEVKLVLTVKLAGDFFLVHFSNDAGCSIPAKY